MPAKRDRTRDMDRLVRSLLRALDANAAKGQSPPRVRRRLGSMCKALHSKCTPGVRKRLTFAFQEASLHADADLMDRSVGASDWVTISTQPFPAKQSTFTTEKALAHFVEQAIGTGPFKGLMHFPKANATQAAREYRLPSGRKIDLLCQEKGRAGNRRLVAIEFKRAQDKGALLQLIDYLDELAKLYPDRQVRGIISARSRDSATRRLVRGENGHHIEWITYEVVCRSAT